MRWLASLLSPRILLALAAASERYSCTQPVGGQLGSASHGPRLPVREAPRPPAGGLALVGRALCNLGRRSDAGRHPATRPTRPGTAHPLGGILTDFPGKRRLARRVIRMPRVLGAINRVRRRAGRPPLQTRSRPASSIAPSQRHRRQPQLGHSRSRVTLSAERVDAVCASRPRYPTLYGATTNRHRTAATLCCVSVRPLVK